MPPNISLPTLPLPLKMEDDEDGERVPSSQSNDPTQSSSTSGLGEDLQTDLTNTTIANASTVPLLIQVRLVLNHVECKISHPALREFKKKLQNPVLK